MINSFTGEYRFLSNFYPAQVMFMGVKFPTVEHACVAAKEPTQKHILKIAKISVDKPGYVKKIGRSCKIRSDWNDVKIEIMTDLILQKFSIPDLKDKLLKTDSHELIEGNFWHDNFWGACYCTKCKNQEKLNNLGKILMNTRDVLKSLV